MSNRLVLAPASLAVSLAAAKKNLRIDGIYLDDVIEIWLRGVISHAENYTERAFMSQTWRLTLPGFPVCGAIKLKRPPLLAVAHVKYYDVNNVQQTMAPALYLVNAEGVQGTVSPLAWNSWPATYPRSDAVAIEYSCGYGVDDSATPDALRLYILAKLNEQFDPLTRPDKVTVQTTFIDGLLDPFGIY